MNRDRALEPAMTPDRSLAARGGPSTVGRRMAPGFALLMGLSLLACGGPQEPIGRSDEALAAQGSNASAVDADAAGGDLAADGSGAAASIGEVSEGDASEGEAPAIDPEEGGDAPDDGEIESQAAPRLSRLTEPGCCTQPWWSPESDALYFIDRPAPDAPTGIWSARLDAPGAPPELLADTVAYYSDDMAYRFDIQGDTTALVRRADGQRWEVPAGGRPVSISPGGDWILWQVSNPDLAFERRVTQVWVSRLDGSEAREIGRLQRGSVSAWIDDARLLVRGRDSLQADEDVLWVMQVADGSLREIARAERLRGELVAPGGAWVAWYVARQQDPSQTGIWLMAIDGGAPRRLDNDLFGAYQWRDDARLLLVPQRTESGAHRLYQVDAASLEVLPLTDPATTPFKIANGDWTVSPDGRRVAFVESRDKAIWVLDLPAPSEAGP